MQVGDYVQHKNLGAHALKIKAIQGSILTLWRHPTQIKKLVPNSASSPLIDVYIVLKSSCTLIDKDIALLLQ